MSATAGSSWPSTCKTRATDTMQPFLTLQYLYGLARAELRRSRHADAGDRGQGRDLRPPSTASSGATWRCPAARGVLAHAGGDWADAARWLGIANPRLTEIGGSHAQRDLFGQLLLDAHLKLGNWAIAEQMLEMRRTWDPDGVPLQCWRRSTASSVVRCARTWTRSGMKPGPRNLITDVAGLRVGNAEDHRDQDRQHGAGRRQAVPSPRST